MKRTFEDVVLNAQQTINQKVSEGKQKKRKTDSNHLYDNTQTQRLKTILPLGYGSICNCPQLQNNLRVVVEENKKLKEEKELQVQKENNLNIIIYNQKQLIRNLEFKVKELEERDLKKEEELLELQWKLKICPITGFKVERIEKLMELECGHYVSFKGHEEYIATANFYNNYYFICKTRKELKETEDLIDFCDADSTNIDDIGTTIKERFLTCPCCSLVYKTKKETYNKII